MNRRVFIALLGAAVASSLAVQAQQPPVPVIGFLGSASPDGYTPYVDAFRQGLKQAGYVEGQNVRIEFRWASGQYDRLPLMAAELVDRKVNLIAASGTPASVAAKAATSTIPVIFSAGADPIQAGLVANLNRPGGNVTGVSQFMSDLGPKRLSIMHDLLPTAGTIAVIVNPESASSVPEMKQMVAAARSIGLQAHLVNARSEGDLDRAFATVAHLQAGAVLVTNDPFLLAARDKIVTLAAAHAIPTIYFAREFVAMGGLVSYAPRIADGYRQAGIYAGRILKGDRISDLPVTQPTKFELVINLKTAKGLGLEIPPSLLARADEVIE